MDSTLACQAPARIHRLSTALANHIAAGEVVERPASVLKELLENSLDAGSTQIDIHIEGGGIGLILVQDNGSGIARDDLPLALAQHATSKIHQLSDLAAIASYGFRGEALASIASVSQLRLSSWVPSQAQGWTVSLEGRSGELSLMPAPAQVGTCVEIRHLFYNTPARRRFLRSEKTEALYVEEVFKRVVLSQPGVSFSFTQNNGVRKRFPAATHPVACSRRVGLVCGQPFLQSSVYLDAEVHGFRLRGYLGLPAALRAQADVQYFYVNHRIVRDKIINHAIRQAYGDRIPPGRHPAYVLYFDLDLQAVDVNVHPTKHEVRFRDARSVHDFLVYALSDAFKQAEGPIEKSTTPLEKGVAHSGASPRFNDAVIASAPLVIAARMQSRDVSDSLPTPDAQPSTDLDLRRALVFPEKNRLFAKMPHQPSTLMVVDLQKSKAVWLERTLVSQYETASIPKRALLFPQAFSIDHAEVLSTGLVDWERLGFDASPIGVDQILVRALPACIARPSMAEDPCLGPFLSTLLQSTAFTQSIHQMAHYASQIPWLSEEACCSFVEELWQSDWFREEGEGLGCYAIKSVIFP